MAEITVYKEEGNSAGHIKRMTLRIPIGASGAPGTAVQSWGYGTAGATGGQLTRTAAGKYTVNLQDRWPANSLMAYNARTIAAAPAAGQGLVGIIVAEAYNVTAPTVPTVTLWMIDPTTGSAADIASGDTLLLEIAFKATANNF